MRNYEKRVAGSIGTCVAVVFCAVLTRLVSQFLGGTRWGSPVAAGPSSASRRIRARGGGRAGPRRRVLRLSMGSTTLLPERRTSPPRPLAAGFVLLLLDPGAPPGGKQGLTAVLGSLAWAGVRRFSSGHPTRVDKSPLVTCPPPRRDQGPRRWELRQIPGGAVPRLHARVGGARGRLLGPVILWSLVAYKLLGPSAQPLRGPRRAREQPQLLPFLGCRIVGSADSSRSRRKKQRRDHGSVPEPGHSVPPR